VRWRIEARDIVIGLVPGRKTWKRNGTIDIGGENEIELLRVTEVIATRGRSTDGRSKGIDIKKGTESGDGLAALSSFRLHLGTANAAQSTESGKRGLPNPEAAGTVIRDSRKTMSTGKSPQRRVGHCLLKPSRSQ
jgi:hypothetical protein